MEIKKKKKWEKKTFLSYRKHRFRFYLRDTLKMEVWTLIQCSLLLNALTPLKKKLMEVQVNDFIRFSPPFAYFPFLMSLLSFSSPYFLSSTIIIFIRWCNWIKSITIIKLFAQHNSFWHFWNSTGNAGHLICKSWFNTKRRYTGRVIMTLLGQHRKTELVII